MKKDRNTVNKEEPNHNKEELTLIIRKLAPVKKHGWGKLLTQIAEGVIVSIDQTYHWQKGKGDE